MADVVISYAHEERDKAQHLAEVLKKFGFEVWWDRNLYAGEDFSAKIEQKIRQSTAVIVLWSVNSVKSRWVQGEASLADELDKLITVKVDECNLPINYRNLHAPEIFKSQQELENLLDLLHRKRVGAGEASSTSDQFEASKREALNLTMSGDFWKDYWKVTSAGLKHPFSFSRNNELSRSFYQKHKKVLWIVFVILIILAALMDQSGY